MSYLVSVTIYCDHPGCERLVTRSRRDKGGLTKTWAGYLARELDGWYTGGHPEGPSDPKVTFCPTHRAEHGHPA